MKKVLFFLILAHLSFNLFGYQWPIAGGFLTASFGENNLNSFLKGIRISGYGSIVSPFLEGEVIYYSMESDSLTSVMGNMRVMQHENGFRSIYGHLENTFQEPDQFELSENDQLGIVGNTGRSYEKSLFLMIFDTKLNQYVNPQIILPPSGDVYAPDITRVLLSRDGETIELKEKNILAPGIVDIAVDVVDTGSTGVSIKTVPYSISLFFLGNEINLIKYDTLKEERGELILQGGRPVSFDNLYIDGNIYLGQINLSKGIAFLEISASDISGNNTNRTFQLTIE